MGVEEGIAREGSGRRGGLGAGAGSRDGGGTAGSGGKFTPDRLRAVRAECGRIVTLLDSYYTTPDRARDMLVRSFVGEWDFDAPESDPAVDNVYGPGHSRRTHDRAAKLVDTMARALVDPGRTEFLIGGIGSSIMAGHDNCRYDSFPSQMSRLLGPVWSAAGMSFSYQNAGMGGSCGDSHLNQHMCHASLVSPDVDVLHYEWTVFEHGPAGATHEGLIRWTSRLPRRPPVHVFNTGERADGEDYVLVGKYAGQGYNAFFMKRGLANGGHDYESEKAGGLDRFGWGIVGDGYHNTTRYGEDETEDRKASLGVLMRNWVSLHPRRRRGTSVPANSSTNVSPFSTPVPWASSSPGEARDYEPSSRGALKLTLTPFRRPAATLARDSDAFTYVYVKAILKALDLIEDEMRRGNDPEERWSESDRPDPDLPDPELCDPAYCQVDRPPSCAVYELPTYGNNSVRVVGAEDGDNPLRGEAQTWAPWRPDHHDPWGSVGKTDTAIFRDREDKSVCYQDDQCAAMQGEYSDGAVVFRLPELVAGLVVICLCCGKEAAVPAFEYPYFEVQLDGEELLRDDWDMWPNRKCIRVKKDLKSDDISPKGPSYLSVKTLPPLEGKGNIKISHVISL